MHDPGKSYPVIMMGRESSSQEILTEDLYKVLWFTTSLRHRLAANFREFRLTWKWSNNAESHMSQWQRSISTGLSGNAGSTGRLVILGWFVPGR